MKKANLNRRFILKKRHQRIFKRLKEGNQRIRVRITKTNSHIYVQALNDLEQRTVAASSSLSLKLSNGNKENCVLIAKDFSKKLRDLKIEKVVLDRGGHSYHGRIAMIADVLREEGIKL